MVLRISLPATLSVIDIVDSPIHARSNPVITLSLPISPAPVTTLPKCPVAKPSHRGNRQAPSSCSASASADSSKRHLPIGSEQAGVSRRDESECVQTPRVADTNWPHSAREFPNGLTRVTNQGPAGPELITA